MKEWRIAGEGGLREWIRDFWLHGTEGWGERRWCHTGRKRVGVKRHVSSDHWVGEVQIIHWIGQQSLCHNSCHFIKINGPSAGGLVWWRTLHPLGHFDGKRVNVNQMSIEPNLTDDDSACSLWIFHMVFFYIINLRISNVVRKLVADTSPVVNIKFFFSLHHWKGKIPRNDHSLSGRGI